MKLFFYLIFSSMPLIFQTYIFSVIIVMEPFNSSFFNRSVHPLDLTIGPRMVRLGKPMLDPICLADYVEPHLS